MASPTSPIHSAKRSRRKGPIAVRVGAEDQPRAVGQRRRQLDQVAEHPGFQRRHGPAGVERGWSWWTSIRISRLRIVQRFAHAAAQAVEREAGLVLVKVGGGGPPFDLHSRRIDGADHAGAELRRRFVGQPDYGGYPLHHFPRVVARRRFSATVGQVDERADALGQRQRHQHGEAQADRDAGGEDAVRQGRKHVRSPLRLG